ncbi:MBL fold metallo-hydrolase [Flavobacteriaceae bacterium]|jgi:pyrroloquinoline quinone biosynthesis protein B|nr:MBL fold metallo-hydrolase [Flavobacteriaceae bacterium]
MILLKYIKFKTLLLLFLLLIGCNFQSQKKEIKANGVSLKVLGTIQDGGIPHLGCNKKCCKDYFLGQTKRVGVSSLGISNLKNNKKYLIDATPDINFQLKELIGNENFSDKLNGIFITHAHMGHYSGLLNLGRESYNSKNIPLYSMPKLHDFVLNNGPWNQLVNLNNINLVKIFADQELILADNLSFTPLQVPHRDEYSETVGFIIKGNSKKALYIPDIDKWNKWNISIVEMIKKVDFAFLDGTFYDSNEINNRDISEIPHPFIIESLDLFKTLSKAEKDKIYFIHLNHTNPVLNRNSKEYNNVISKGFNIAETGMEFIL